MFDPFLLIAATMLALMSTLAWRPAPPWMWAWKMAIVVTEFGHWLSLAPFGVAMLAVVSLEMPANLILAAFGVVAGGAMWRPAGTAARLARTLPEQLRRAFGEPHRRPRHAPLSFARLFWRERLRRVSPRTELFAEHADGPLLLDFYPANSAEPAPCIVVVHGGGWDGGDRTQLDAWNSVWAARGFAVAAVSYRLAPRHCWPAQREDVVVAFAWLKTQAARLRIDPTRFVFLGRSAGGQIATAVAYGLRDPAIVGVVSLYAPQDMPFAWSVSSERDALNSAKLMRQYLGGPPDTEARRLTYDSASGQRMVGADTPPTLLLHGEPDTLVWVRHSERLAARLAESGVPHAFVRLPWATHGFDFNLHGPGGQLADYALAWFLACVTGGRCSGV